MGNQTVKQEQKQHADPKSDKGREEGQLAHALRLLNGGDQQAPDRCCHHHPGGKARKGALHRIAERFFIKNTQAAPSVVPKKGIMIPRKVSICLTAFALRFYLFLLKPASSRYSGCDFTYGSLSPQMV